MLSAGSAIASATGFRGFDNVVSRQLRVNIGANLSASILLTRVTRQRFPFAGNIFLIACRAFLRALARTDDPLVAPG